VKHHRATPEPIPILSLCLLADGSGRIRHVTNNLAAMLDSTPAALLAEGATNALDAVLPEPYAQIHAYRRHEINMISSFAKKSSTSCMLGAPVCLRTMAKSQVEQSRLLPVKLEARLHQTSQTSDVTCAIKVKPLTMDQALNERRLKVRSHKGGSA
jgi:hypothetical protein